jgi:ribonucleoside-diphosphate reductase alpha chain
MKLKHAVFDRNVMPSMRSVMTAGAALERDHVAGYNCSFVPVDITTII